MLHRLSQGQMQTAASPIAEIPDATFQRRAESCSALARICCGKLREKRTGFDKNSCLAYRFAWSAESSALLPKNGPTNHIMANKRNSEVTGRKAASAAAKILCSPYSSKAEKSAAAAALTQRPNRAAKRNSEVTGKQVASIAAKILRSPHSSRAAKRAAASALTQRPDKA